MALSISLLTNGRNSVTNPSTTASISPTNGGVVYAIIGAAQNTGTLVNNGPDIDTPSGNNFHQRNGIRHT